MEKKETQTASSDILPTPTAEDSAVGNDPAEVALKKENLAEPSNTLPELTATNLVTKGNALAAALEKGRLAEASSNLTTSNLPTPTSPNSALQDNILAEKPTQVADSASIYSTSCTQIRDLLLKEVKSMTRYSMSSGMYQLPDHIYPIIEAFSVEYEEREKEKQRLKENYVFKACEALELIKLVEVHDLLSQAITPATPRAVMLLDPVFAEKSWLSWISPVPLLRRLMIVAFISLNGFIFLSLSPYITANGGDIFNSDGLPLLTNLMFFAFSASLGACFSALFQANNYIVDGVFDPKFEPSYWIRLLVGIIAGLILASLIPLNPKALNGLGKPTLSLLGGFSASLVYRILNLLVSFIEDIVKRMGDAMLGGNAGNKDKDKA